MSVIVTFPFVLPGAALYADSKSLLVQACVRFARVLVVPVFETEFVSVAAYQKFLAHIYLTLAHEANPACECVVVDPSVGLVSVLAQDDIFGFDVVSADVAARSPEHHRAKESVSRDLGLQPQLCDSFPHSQCVVQPRFAHTVNGGTFDRLHNGHRVLLGASMAVSQLSITVGITSDAMIQNGKKTLKELVEPYTARQISVERFLKLCNPSVLTKTPAIDDAFGPSIVDPQLSCIIVSQETAGGGKAVNDKRKEVGLSNVEIVVVDVWDSYNHAVEGSVETKISSTDARKRIAAGRSSKI